MSPSPAVTTPDQRLEVLFEELAELAGQRNAIDGRIVEIVAESGSRRACGGRPEPVRWRGWWPGSWAAQSANAKAIATVARRSEAFPRCVGELREGRLSLDQVGVIAARAADGSDEHYAQLAAVATVNQLRTAITARTATRPRSASRTTALDHHDHQRGIQQLADHPSPRRGGHVRRGAAVSSGWVDRRVETRPRQRFLASLRRRCRHRRRVCASGRGRLGRRSRPPPARGAHHGGGARRCRGARRRPASGSAAVRRRPPLPDL